VSVTAAGISLWDWMSIFARNLGGCLVAYSYSQSDSLYFAQCNLVLCPVI
jgi:hypothetical protein